MKQLTPFITERDGIPVTTSRAVAEQFGKKHQHVLRDIEVLLSQLNESKIGLVNDDAAPKIGVTNELNFEPVKSNLSQLTQPKIGPSDTENEQTNTDLISPGNAEFATQNFLLTEYKDGKGELRPEYLLTRDGFTLLAMGFTGAKALTFKVAYINAFNRMEQLLHGGITSTALQNIEERLQALEKTAGEGKSEVMDKVAQTYLDALKEAIGSGKYIIAKRFARHEDPKLILGIEDRDIIAIKTVLSYRIYSAFTSKPLARLALWGVLEGAGAILPKGKHSPKIKISGNKYSVIYIPSNKLIDREGEGKE